MRPRLYLPCPLSENIEPTLSTEQAHYLRHVLRLREGDLVDVFNGQDGLWSANVCISKREVQLRIGNQQQAQPSVGPARWLIVAPCKRQDMVVEKATELGITEIQPIITTHTTVRQVNHERWQKWAIEAAEQSERLTLPRIHLPQQLKEFLEKWPPTPPLYWCAERRAVSPLWRAISSIPISQEMAILIGPEGGFSDSEAALLSSSPKVKPVSLGENVLRTETAVIVACAVLMQINNT